MTAKINLQCDEDLWKQVQIYKINSNCKTNNEAVLKLIKKALVKQKAVRDEDVFL